MSAGKVIYHILSNDSAVSAIVSTRIFPNVIDENADYPAIRYQHITNSPNDTKDGASTLDDVRVQIDCWAKTKDSASDLADKIRLALDRQTGTIGSTGITIAGFKFEDHRDDFEAESRLYRESQDFKIMQRR